MTNRKGLCRTLLFQVRVAFTPSSCLGQWGRRLACHIGRHQDHLAAGSGLNAFTPDEDHAREFIRHHQDKLMYRSDCNDHDGEGSKCSGAGMTAAIRRLPMNPDWKWTAPSPFPSPPQRGRGCRRRERGRFRGSKREPVRRILSPTNDIRRKLLYGNAKRVFRI